MCEYVDHLHEHFASPVVIHNGHYMPPKVRSAYERRINFFPPFLSVCIFSLLPDFRIWDILVRCWHHRCRLTATQRETCGRQTQANED